MQLYEQILKEFDKKFLCDCENPNKECYQGDDCTVREMRGELKSFLKQSFIRFLESECEKWIKVFDYHNDMSNERHSTIRNVARTEIEYFKKLMKEME